MCALVRRTEEFTQRAVPHDCMSLVSLLKQLEGSDNKSNRPEAHLWTRRGMANIEPQLDEEHVSRAVNLLTSRRLQRVPRRAVLTLRTLGRCRRADFDEATNH